MAARFGRTDVALLGTLTLAAAGLVTSVLGSPDPGTSPGNHLDDHACFIGNNQCADANVPCIGRTGDCSVCTDTSGPSGDFCRYDPDAGGACYYSQTLGCGSKKEGTCQLGLCVTGPAQGGCDVFVCN